MTGTSTRNLKIADGSMRLDRGEPGDWCINTLFPSARQAAETHGKLPERGRQYLEYLTVDVPIKLADF